MQSKANLVWPGREAGIITRVLQQAHRQTQAKCWRRAGFGGDVTIFSMHFRSSGVSRSLGESDLVRPIARTGMVVVPACGVRGLYWNHLGSDNCAFC